MTLPRYLKEYFGFYGILEIFSFVIPLLGKLMKIENILAPPLEWHFLFLFFLCYFTFIFSTYFVKDLRIIKRSWGYFLFVGIILIMMLSSLIFYIYMFEKVVVRVYIPSEKETVRLIVGTERSKEAERLYSTKTDIEMLKDAGFMEDVIKKLWTPESVNYSRTLVSISYFLILLSFVEIIALATLKSVLNNAGKSKGE